MEQNGGVFKVVEQEVDRRIQEWYGQEKGNVNYFVRKDLERIIEMLREILRSYGLVEFVKKAWWEFYYARFEKDLRLKAEIQSTCVKLIDIADEVYSKFRDRRNLGIGVVEDGV